MVQLQWCTPTWNPHTTVLLGRKAQNRFLTVLRCICERGNALLKASWRYLRRVTCCPKRITQIARAALALTHLAYGW